MQLSPHKDYRSFLAAYYKQQKESNPNFSFRAWSKKTGVSSPSFYSEIISAKKNLSLEKLDDVCEACEIQADERPLFKLWVQRELCKDPGKRQQIEILIKHFQSPLEFTELGSDLAKYLSKWYLPALREAAHEQTLSQISKRTAKWNPPLSQKETTDGLQILVEIGQLKIDKGRYSQLNTILKSDSKNGQQELAKRWQKRLVLMGFEALEDQKPKTKKFNTSTLSLDETQSDQVIKILANARDEILKIASKEQTSKSKVFIWNSQFFSLDP